MNKNKEELNLSEKEKLVFKDISQDFSKKANNFIVFEKKNNSIKSRIPQPFVKWAGGKRQLLPQLKSFFPKDFNKYIEPFVGGGAVFFYLFRKKKLVNKKSILIDINQDLINSYDVIKYHVRELINSLKKHKNEKIYYYKVRDWDKDDQFYNNLSNIEKASRLIYLNKCCYNGLYRVNSKGQFNVPFGKYKNPNLCDEKNLVSIKKALHNIDIIHGSFEKCLDYAESGDFLYLDPPYYPISKTSSFTNYAKEDFGIKHQKILFNIFKELDNRGCKLMLSNSFSEFVKNLYKDYRKVALNAKRAINCDATKRGSIKEILILNNY